MKYRICFEKKDDMIYISLLDFQSFLQRALRRAGLEMEFSNGFNPHPKIEYGPAVGLFIPSEGEYVDIVTKYEYPETDVIKRLNKQLPKGLKIVSIGRLGSLDTSLSKALCAAKFTFRFRSPISTAAIREFFDAEDIIVCKKNKKGITVKKDISECIEKVEDLSKEGDMITLSLILSQRPETLLNPNLVIGALTERFPGELSEVAISKGESMFF